MLATLLAIPILGGLLILQTAVVNRIPLLHGAPDLLLLVVAGWALQKRVDSAWTWSLIAALMVALVSALPLVAPLAVYPLTAAIALLLRRRTWQAPILAMLVTVFLATLVSQAAALISLRLFGVDPPWLEVLNLFTLPSLLLNLLLALPVYAVMNDLAGRMYPEPLEI
jgi:cell shape-determining protein MreD